jgi:hypothetical protein
MRTREYAGRADLRAMQRLVQEAWAVVGSKNERHVGDGAWADTHIPGRQDEFRRRSVRGGGTRMSPLASARTTGVSAT